MDFVQQSATIFMLLKARKSNAQTLISQKIDWLPIKHVFMTSSYVILRYLQN